MIQPLTYKILFLLWLMSAGLSAFCQSHKYTQFTSDDGLASDFLYRVVEDDDGFIWISSDNGVSKFDGQEFRNYTVDDGLPINETYSIMKDKSGCLWLGNMSGKICYIKKDSVICLAAYNDYALHPQSANGEISCFNSEFILTLFDGKVISKIQHKNYLDSLVGQAEEVLETRVKRTAVRSLGEALIEINNNVINLIEGKNVTTYSTGNEMTRFLGSSKNMAVFEGDEYLYILNAKNKHFKSYPLELFYDAHIVMVFQEGLADDLYLHSPKARFHFDSNLKLNTYSNKLYDKFTVKYCYEDSYGNYWITTEEAGLFLKKKSSLTTSQFHSDDLVNNKFEKLISTSSEIYGLTSNGNTYKMNEKGLSLVNRNKNITNFYDAKYFNDQILLSSNYMLRKFNPSSGKIKSFINKTQLEKYQVNAGRLVDHESIMFNIKSLDATDEVLVCSNRIFTYSIDTKSKSISTLFRDKSQEIYKSEFQDIFYMASGKTILSYDYINENLDTLIICDPDFTNENRINACNEFYNVIFELGPSKLILASENNGVFYTDLIERKIQKISSRERVKAIEKYNDTIYFAGNEGITLLDSSFNEIYNYSSLDGLPSNRVNDIVLNDTAIVAATNTGISVVDKSKNVFLKRDKSERLTISYIQSNQFSFSEYDDLSFLNGDNNIKIAYHFLDYESTGNIKYAYKLLPVENDWHMTAEGAANYVNLKTGDYTFMLKAIDEMGDEHILEHPVAFSIQKAFWQKAWFIVLGTIAFLFGVFSLTLFLIRRAKLQYEKENEYNQLIMKLKMESLRSQMNPHFIFNALGSIQYYIREHKIEEADEYLALFAQLMRRFLDSAIENVIKMNIEILLLSEYTELEEMRFGDKFNTTIKVDHSIDPETEWLPSMLIQPYVENAINHGLLKREEGGLLNINFYKEDENELICEISDNGIGVINSKKNKFKRHKSRAMKNVQDRLQVFANSGVAQVSVNTSTLSNDPLYPGTKVKLFIKDFNKYEELYGNNN